jgi:ATP-dependent Lon protease
MPKVNQMTKSGKKDRKDSGEAETKKTPVRKGFVPKRRMAGHDDDDDSIDSRGNIRGLIAYSDEDDLVSTTTSESEMEEKPRKKRAAAKKAGEKIRRKLEKERQRQSDESDDESDSDFVPRRRSRPSKKVVEESEEEDEEETEDSDEESEAEETDAETTDGEEEHSAAGINIIFGADDFEERMVPKRHNMKKEPASVKKFVKLLQEPLEENTIDDHIDYFKGLAEDKQKQILDTLERKPKGVAESLMFRILEMKLPVETQAMILAKYNTLQQMDPSTGEYFKMRAWLEKVTSVPFGQFKEFPVKITDGQEACGAFMDRGRKYLNDAVFGQDESKLQILQFMASKIANPDARGTCLLLVGPPGIGKTSLIKNGIARALGWPFQFISLGGDSDASNYTGHQVVYEGSHCGKIVNSVIAAKSMSMILMFDEVDKISTTEKGQEVQNLLIHLTDPVQNGEFEDRYLAGVPIDLSKTMFVFSANDINKIDRVLLDRMTVIDLKGYSAKEKHSIAENFLVPIALKELNLCEKVSFGKDVIEHIISEYASEEKGVRQLKRSIEQIAQKINMLRMFNTADLPFHIPNFTLPFTVKKEHVSLFLKKKEKDDVSHLGMYM